MPGLIQKIIKEHKEQLQQDATCDYSLLCGLQSLISSLVESFFSLIKQYTTLQSWNVALLSDFTVAALELLCLCVASCQLEQEKYTHKQQHRARIAASFFKHVKVNHSLKKMSVFYNLSLIFVVFLVL